MAHKKPMKTLHERCEDAAWDLWRFAGWGYQDIAAVFGWKREQVEELLRRRGRGM